MRRHTSSHEAKANAGRETAGQRPRQSAEGAQTRPGTGDRTHPTRATAKKTPNPARAGLGARLSPSWQPKATRGEGGTAGEGFHNDKKSTNQVHGRESCGPKWRRSCHQLGMKIQIFSERP